MNCVPIFPRNSDEHCRASNVGSPAVVRADRSTGIGTGLGATIQALAVPSPEITDGANGCAHPGSARRARMPEQRFSAVASTPSGGSSGPFLAGRGDMTYIEAMRLHLQLPQNAVVLPSGWLSTRTGGHRSRYVIERCTVKDLPTAVERRPRMARRIVLSTGAVVVLMAAALMTPSVALATPTSPPDPYSSTSETTPETDTTTETTPETDTTTETTPETDTTTETTTTPETDTTPAELAVFDPGPCVGAFVTTSGSGFGAGEPIDLLRDGVTVTTVAAAADGSFSVRVDIAGVQNGVHVITATGTISGFSSSGAFDVEPQVCTTESGTTVVAVVATESGAAVVVAGSGTALASTGFPTVQVLAAAVLALLVGTMLLIPTRNRRVARPSDNAGPRHL